MTAAGRERKLREGRADGTAKVGLRAKLCENTKSEFDVAERSVQRQIARTTKCSLRSVIQARIAWISGLTPMIFITRFMLGNDQVMQKSPGSGSFSARPKPMVA
jgi:hypothetical protein